MCEHSYLRNPGSDLPWAFAVKLWEPKSNNYKMIHLAALSPSEHWDWVNAFEKSSEFQNMCENVEPCLLRVVVVVVVVLIKNILLYFVNSCIGMVTNAFA